MVMVVMGMGMALLLMEKQTTPQGMDVCHSFFLFPHEANNTTGN
jgi:hypothetical protein